MQPAENMPAAPEGAIPAQPSQIQHVHHSYIWLGSLRAVGMLLFVLIVTSAGSLIGLVSSLSYSSASAVFALPIMFALGVGAIAVLFGIVVGIHAWSYRHLYYELGPEEFNLYSGIISKKRVHVPYNRVQTVDQRASLIQRLFGVCNVSIDTAGGSSNKAILVPYLSKEQAQLLKSELYARKMGVPAAAVSNVSENASAHTPSASGQEPSGNILDAGERVWNEVGGVFAGGDVADVPVTYEYGLSNKELIFTGLSNNTGPLLAAVLVVGAIIQFASNLFEIVPGSEDAVFNTVAASAASWGMQQMVAAGIFAFVMVVLIVWIVSTVSACINYGGFHARRRGSRIEVERGLLQHQSQSVAIDRIQSVVIKQTFVRRILGYCELGLGKVDTAEEGSGQKNQAAAAGKGILVIHPFLKKSRVDEILAGLVPEFADVPQDFIKVSPKALRRGLVRRCIWQGNGFWMAVAALVLLVLARVAAPLADDPEFYEIVPYLDILCFILFAFAILLFIWDAVSAVFWARESGFGFNRRFMMVRNGGLSRNTVCFPKSKVQFGYTRTNPLQQLAGTTTLCVVTAAGVGGTTTRLIDAGCEDASAWLDWVKPRTA